MTTTITVDDHGLRQRLEQFSDVYNREAELTMRDTLLVMRESVPPYPPQPEGSTYRRTGTLGRTLTGGDALGIYEVQPIGGSWEGRFGTALEYAPYVIGDDTQAAQNSHWWTLGQVVERAMDKINRLWESLAADLAKFAEGKGL